MKINSHTGKLLNQVDQSSQADKKTLNRLGKKETKGQNPLSGSVKVDLSKEVSAYQKAREIASKDDIDYKKVNRLQKLIDEGKYNVDAREIADRLVDEHLKMNS
ncbi:MAG: flagellar biosynthesis anti-sigma factor FlgM [Bdellovibrio sp.]|nr:MAG: flagellar biosynthesis anti-sigma factor FlgM [Bdellovibrio sp.]